ncbi:hypothetical protein LTR84_008516 [Exophiala bonariae]|uniref:Zn(2)-C6 fungal-type domain-containing protein n=1 Tax=Exophiala bonariae TaxID=1690606 RepID=A0AAV9MXP3_9EURO|nr:hypothetical protein LTR84_008516 [Exophiala bonariae]
MRQQRSACDHCRGQKVRCLRNKQLDSEICVRCLRIGVECITSKSRRLGRPRGPKAAERKPTSTTKGTSKLQVIRAHETPSTDLMAEDLEIPSELWMPSNSNCSSGVLLGPSNSICVDHGSLPPVTTFGSTTHCASDLLMPFDDSFFNAESFLELPGQARDSPSYVTYAQSLGDMYHLDASEPADSLSALARLNEHISRQIPHVDAYLSRPDNEPQHCRNDISDSKGKPADDILQSTSRFITILEALKTSSTLAQAPISSVVRQPPTLDPDNNESSFQGSGLPPSQSVSSEIRAPMFPVPWSTPLVLMMLSSYILLLDLYDTVFRHVYDKISRVKNFSKFSQDMPEIKVGGLSSMKVHLYAKIVIQTIEHHFDRIEQLLGLPVEFRLSAQDPCSDGLLGNANLLHLLSIAMMQITGNPGRSGTTTLKSFRDNLKGVQAILPD